MGLVVRQIFEVNREQCHAMRTEEAGIAGLADNFLQSVQRLQLGNVLLHALLILLPANRRIGPQFKGIVLLKAG